VWLNCLVVDAEVVHDDSALGNAGGAARLEDIPGTIGVALGNPAPNWPATEPFILEVSKELQILEALHMSLSGLKL
jgi:hypothetical protein